MINELKGIGAGRRREVLPEGLLPDLVDSPFGPARQLAL